MYGPGFELLLNRILANRVGRIVVAVLTCVAATVLFVLIAPIEFQSIRLSRNFMQTTARVTESKEVEPTDFLGSTHYTLRYAFDIHGKTYYHRRPFGDAMVSLPKAEFEAAVNSGQVQVIYEPGDPWNNDLAYYADGLVRWALIFLLGTGGAAVAAWAWAAWVIRAEVRRWITV